MIKKKGKELLQKHKITVDKIFWVILSFSLLIIFYRFLIGKAYYMYFDIGADTINQYFPYFTNEVLNLKNGSLPIWNYSYGLGETFLNMNAWTMDPFAIILVMLGFVFGINKLKYFLVLMQICKIIIVYIFTKKYLSYFLKDKLSICLASYLCSMNGFIFLWGQHYFFGTACVYLILMLYALEYFLHNKNVKSIVYLSLITASLLVFSYYIGYMILICSGIYFVFRYIYLVKKINIKPMIIDFAKCMYGIINGFLLSCVIFVPSCYHILTSSSRLNGASQSFIVKIITTFKESFDMQFINFRISRILSNNLLFMNDSGNFSNTNYYEMPQLFCTIFILFFIIQWIIYEFKKSKTKKDYIFFALKIIGLYLLLFNKVSGLLFNAFAYSTDRYTYLLFPFFAIIIGTIFEKIIIQRKINVVGLIISFLLTLYSLYYSYSVSLVPKMVYIALIFTIFGYFLLLLINRKFKYYKLILVVFIVTLIMNNITDNYVTTNKRSYGTKSNFSLYWVDDHTEDDTGRAIKWLKDTDSSYYRVDKTYNLISQYGDAHLYDISTNQSYNSSINVDLDNYYKYIYPNSYTQYAYKDIHIEDASDLQAEYITNTKYILSLSEINLDDLQEIKRVGSVIIYRNIKTDCIAKWYNKTITKEEYFNLSDENKQNILYDNLIADNSFKLDGNSSAEVGNFYIKNNSVSGNVNSTGNGLLMISIPNQDGWNVYIDGKPVKKYKVDFGFIGIKVSKGKHNIRLRYNIPKFKGGLILTFVGLLDIFLIIIFEFKSKRSN